MLRLARPIVSAASSSSRGAAYLAAATHSPRLSPPSQAGLWFNHKNSQFAAKRWASTMEPVGEYISLCLSIEVMKEGQNKISRITDYKDWTEPDKGYCERIQHKSWIATRESRTVGSDGSASEGHSRWRKQIPETFNFFPFLPSPYTYTTLITLSYSHVYPSRAKDQGREPYRRGEFYLSLSPLFLLHSLSLLFARFSGLMDSFTDGWR
jgi:hypothetical protein